MTTRTPSTPCIGVCSTVFGDPVCRGCRRFTHEVVHWNGYDAASKALVWQRLSDLLELVVNNYIEVVDSPLLAEQMGYQNLRCQPQLTPEGWVPELLKAAGQQPLPYAQFGLKPTLSARGLSPRQLYDRISEESYALARAHYDRSFARPVKPTKELVVQAAKEKGWEIPE